MTAQALVNGLTLGLVYALTAVGFSMIFGTARILFLAHGSIYMLGAISGFYFVQGLHVPYILALIITMVVIGAFGVIIEKFFRRFRGQELATLVVSTALGMIIAQAVLLSYGQEGRAISSPFRGTIDLFGTTFSVERIVIVLTSLAIVLALHFFIQRAKAGQAIRAITQDVEAAVLQGIDINRSHILVFVLALATAGVAGILVAPLYFVDPFSDTPALMRTFIVVIIGGIGSFPGAIAGGLLLGFIESFATTFIGGQLAYLASFVIVIMVLAVRPQGLFGREEI